MFSEEMSLYLGNVPQSAPVLPPTIASVWVATWGPGVNYKSNTSRLRGPHLQADGKCFSCPSSQRLDQLRSETPSRCDARKGALEPGERGQTVRGLSGEILLFGGPDPLA